MPITPHHNEQDLLAKIAVGDESAFAEIFKWYYEGLGNQILRLTESITLTEEIVQDAFVQIWLKRETLTEINNFSAYLFILCRNQAFAVLKKLAKEKKLQPIVEKHLQWEADFDDLENPSEHFRLMIAEAVKKLPLQQQRIYLLSRQEKLKYEEIASQLNISPETVKTQIYNSVKFIRKHLESKIAPAVIMVLTSALTRHS
jgi:RNA polymerase sigma-70 factor (family 1)